MLDRSLCDTGKTARLSDKGFHGLAKPRVLNSYFWIRIGAWLSLFPRKLQARPVRIDSTNFVIDKTGRQTSRPDIVLIEVHSVTAGFFGVDDPNRRPLRQ